MTASLETSTDATVRLENKLVIDADHLTPEALARIEQIVTSARYLREKPVGALSQLELLTKLEELHNTATKSISDMSEVALSLQVRQKHLEGLITEDVIDTLSVAMEALRANPEIAAKFNRILSRLGKPLRIGEQEIERAEGAIFFLLNLIKAS
ncbi:MAG: hypothetical protein QM645_14170 [Asticcacaulis sp.]